MRPLTEINSLSPDHNMQPDNGIVRLYYYVWDQSEIESRSPVQDAQSDNVIVRLEYRVCGRRKRICQDCPIVLPLPMKEDASGYVTMALLPWHC